MDENEREESESELTDLTDSVGWRLSLPLSTPHYPAATRRRSRTDERPWFDAEYIFIQLHRLKRRKGEEGRARGSGRAWGKSGREDEEGGMSGGRGDEMENRYFHTMRVCVMMLGGAMCEGTGERRSE